MYITVITTMRSSFNTTSIETNKRKNFSSLINHKLLFFNRHSFQCKRPVTRPMIGNATTTTTT